MPRSHVVGFVTPEMLRSYGVNMTSLRLLNPSPGMICPKGQYGEIVIEITKPAWLLVYTVAINVLSADSVILWTCLGTIISGQAKTSYTWPSEAGNYIIEAILCNAIGEEDARIREQFVVQ